MRSTAIHVRGQSTTQVPIASVKTTLSPAAPVCRLVPTRSAAAVSATGVPIVLRTSAKSGRSVSVLMAWLPNVLFCAAGVWLLREAAKV